jgi:hypothetical protein
MFGPESDLLFASMRAAAFFKENFAQEQTHGGKVQFTGLFRKTATKVRQQFSLRLQWIGGVFVVTGVRQKCDKAPANTGANH